MYCVAHDCYYDTFPDSTAICVGCVEDEVLARKGEAANIYRRIERALSGEEFWQIEEAARDNSKIYHEPKQISLLRFIAIRAHRSGKTIDEIVNEIIDTKRISAIA